ncbi:MAG TPA: alpha/beta fold hydrolase [Candidatus Acidoferrales bacterium]|nr:alpha/beta fold hydrolase [Candidatus Acidoferrales bacterium]
MPQPPPNHWIAPVFDPHPWLANAHVMTAAAALWRRRFPRLLAPADRLVETEPGTRILVRCHWQREPRRRPTLILVHGLEGSSESGYMLGAAERAWEAGFNVARMNQRNCGGTDHLTPTLYNSSLSGDVRAVLEELIERDALPEIFVAGFSLGGNLALKMGGEMNERAPAELAALAVVSPSLDLAACADAIEQPRNWLYERYFVSRLKRRMVRKARLFPGRYRLDGLRRVGTIREFDECFTAPHGGFHDAEDYYFRASALRVIGALRRPALVLAAEDDPMVPFASLDRPAIRAHRFIQFVGPRRGGHCGFISRGNGDERFWAEKIVVDYCRRQSRLVLAVPKDAAAGAAPPVAPGGRQWS